MNKSTIDDITQNLTLEEGIWYSNKNENLSYPDDYDLCFSLEDNSFWFNHRKNAILECLKLAEKNSVFLDLGGGNGFMTKAMSNLGYESYLIEPGQNGASNAKTRGVKNILCAFYEDIPSKSIEPKIVGAFDVLEHIKEPNQLLLPIRKTFNKADKLILTIPAFNNLWSNEDVKAGHFRRYTRSTVKSELKESNFEVIYSTYFFSWLPLPIILFRKFGKKTTHDGKDHKDHHEKAHNPHWIVSKIFKVLSSMEIALIRRNISIPFGSSLLVIARPI